jgi:hypothetical protein
MLFPSQPHAKQAVADLVEMGVDEKHIHTVAKEGVNTDGLPTATVRQRTDLAGRIDNWLWDINLLVFFFAFALMLIAAWNASWGWAIAGLVASLGTFLIGNHYVQHVPHAHMTECQTAIRHGEILLLVDVPRWRQAKVEKAMRKRHSEIEIGGIGWTVDALGI